MPTVRKRPTLAQVHALTYEKECLERELVVERHNASYWKEAIRKFEEQQEQRTTELNQVRKDLFDLKYSLDRSAFAQWAAETDLRSLRERWYCRFGQWLDGVVERFNFFPPF